MLAMVRDYRALLCWIIQGQGQGFQGAGSILGNTCARKRGHVMRNHMAQRTPMHN